MDELIRKPDEKQNFKKRSEFLNKNPKFETSLEFFAKYNLYKVIENPAEVVGKERAEAIENGRYHYDFELSSVQLLDELDRNIIMQELVATDLFKTDKHRDRHIQNYASDYVLKVPYDKRCLDCDTLINFTIEQKDELEKIKGGFPLTDSKLK